MKSRGRRRARLFLTNRHNIAESLRLQQLKVEEIICEGYSIFISGKEDAGSRLS